MDEPPIIHLYRSVAKRRQWLRRRQFDDFTEQYFRLPNFDWRYQLTFAVLILTLCLIVTGLLLVTRSRMLSWLGLLPLLALVASQRCKGLPLERVGLILESPGLLFCGRPIPYNQILAVQRK